MNRAEANAAPGACTGSGSAPGAGRGLQGASTLNPGLLQSLELKVLAIQRIEAGRWWNYQRVISPFSRLWLILDGRARVRHHGREFSLEPGQLHLVPPFTRHDCACARRFDHYCLHVVARLATGIDLLSLVAAHLQLAAPPRTLELFQRLEALCPDRKLPCFDPAREEYRRFPLDAEQAAGTMPAADWFESDGLVRCLLAPFLHGARAEDGLHARATRRFLAVQQYIHGHMHTPILLGDLARAARLHPTYFSDRFRELVGVRPLEYLARRRIERAQYLLLSRRASVKQVALEVGIPDAAYFSRLFARVCGVSPTAYRTTHGMN